MHAPRVKKNKTVVGHVKYHCPLSNNCFGNMQAAILFKYKHPPTGTARQR